MLVELLENDLIKERHSISRTICRYSQTCLILENVKISAERYQVALHLSCDLLALASSTQTIAGTVVTVPVLVADNVMQTIIEVGLEAKGAKLSFAFVVNTFLLTRLAL